MDILALLDELRILAHNALPFTQDPYDRARYTRILELVEQYYGVTLELPHKEVRRRLATELGRITPSVGANAAIFDQHGAIVLMQRHDSGLWCLPGGLVEVHETPAQTAVREAREETGLHCHVVQLVDMFQRPAGIQGRPHSLIAVVYLCAVDAGTLRNSSESLDVRYRQLDEPIDWLTDHREQAEAAYALWRAMNNKRSAKGREGTRR